MLTHAEEVAWDAYVADRWAQGLEVDLKPLKAALLGLQGSASGRIIADAVGVGTMPLTDLAKRLTLQFMRIITTGHVPE